MSPRSFAVVGTGLLILACSPDLDWREFGDPATGVRVAFPCRPQRVARTVALVDVPMRLELLSCQAGGATWGLSYADVGDPGRVGPTLAALATAAQTNVGAASAPGSPAGVRGATPNPRSLRFRLAGKLPDGRNVAEETMVFAKGTRVFQATVVGERLRPEAVEPFMTALRFDR